MDKLWREKRIRYGVKEGALTYIMRQTRKLQILLGGRLLPDYLLKHFIAAPCENSSRNFFLLIGALFLVVLIFTPIFIVILTVIAFIHLILTE